MARVVQNPVHPLDLNLNSLMVIYKKFEEAKRLSNNPNQQLPIDLLVQLISRLIDQEPSHLQKELTKSLYKRTISWNQFLNFLDQQSQARENILNWIMYEMSTKQFRFQKEVNCRYFGHFQEISWYRPVVCEGRQYSLLLLDKERFILADSHEEKIVVQLKIKREKQVFTQQKQGNMLASALKMNSIVQPPPNIAKKKKTDIMEHNPPAQSSPHVRSKPSSSMGNKGIDRSQRVARSALNMGPTEDQFIEEQTYVVKERKRLNEAFQIFQQLPMQSSHELAEYVTNKIQKRRMVDLNVTDLKETYKDYLNRRRDLISIPTDEYKDRINKIKGIMKPFQEDKRSFSYNPYRLQTRSNTTNGGQFLIDKKRVSFEKKQKQNDLAVRTLTFMESRNLCAVALFNFEVVLLQICREFNKIQILQHARVKVPKELDRKKNEVIECMAFHFHEIFHHYQLLVLVRVENYSYVRCFNLIETPTQKGGFTYSLSKEVFCQKLPFEAVTLTAEEDFGFHVIGCGGWLHSYKDDLTERDDHYTLSHQQRFKGDLVFSCMAVSKPKRKMAFGTVGGSVCFFDSFTKELSLTRKVSSRVISSLIFDDSCSQLLIFSSDEVLTVYDTNRLEEIQVLNVRNEDRLHEHSSFFTLNYEKGEAVLSFYGSEFRQFVSYVDEDRNNRKRKIECTYHWRLNKIEGENDPEHRLPPKVLRTSDSKRTDELMGVVETDKYFVTMSKRYELKLFSRKSYRVKFSLILALSEQESLIAFNVSADSKVLVYSTEDQNLKIVNIYTEELYQIVAIGQKVTHLQFLSQRNEYFIVTGAECGKISFVPSYLSQGKLAIKALPVHKRSVTTVSIVGQYLLTAGEDSLLVVWQLPFNVIKFEINLHERKPKDFVIEVNPTKNFRRIFCRSNSSIIYELDAREGLIRDSHQELSIVNVLSCCYSEQLNELYLLDEDLKLSIYEGNLEQHSNIKAKTNNATGSNMKRPLARKETKVFSKKRSDSQSHPAEVPSKWRLKSLNNIKEKGVSQVTILPNLQMGSIVFFLSRGYFYIYDQLEDRFRGKYCYSTGDFLKNDVKVNNINPLTKTTAKRT